jgi:hypothetical protein
MFLLIVRASAEIGMVQNRPLSAIPALKSWSCSPELGS